MAYDPKDQNTCAVQIEGTEAQYLKNQMAIELLKAWRTDDAQEQRETWITVKVASARHADRCLRIPSADH